MRRRHAGEDVGDLPGRVGLEHRRRRPSLRGAGVDAVAERHRRAAAGDRGVELDEVAERDADAAEADGEAGRRQRRAAPAAMPARFSRATSRAGPTASSTTIAGMLSDSVSASRMVTVPRKKPSKFCGA